MPFHRGHRDTKLVGDLLIRRSGSHEPQDLRFANGEPVRRGARRGGSLTRGFRSMSLGRPDSQEPIERGDIRIVHPASDGVLCDDHQLRMGNPGRDLLAQLKRSEWKWRLVNY